MLRRIAVAASSSRDAASDRSFFVDVSEYRGQPSVGRAEQDTGVQIKGSAEMKSAFSEDRNREQVDDETDHACSDAEEHSLSCGQVNQSPLSAPAHSKTDAAENRLRTVYSVFTSIGFAM